MITENDLLLEKTYRKEIYAKFLKAIFDYEMIKPDDKIAVCISGGKDSFLLARLFQLLKKQERFKDLEIKYIVMNPGYLEENISLIKENAKKLKIDIEVFESTVFSISQKLNPKNPCYMCARMRRGFLYDTAQKLGCNKIALGHHFDDVVETVLMSIFYGAEYKTMMPKLKSTNFSGMELIRPLYFIREKDIIKWKDKMKLNFLSCACIVESRDNSSKRKEIKEFIENYKKINPNIDINIFRSTENINLNTVLGYSKDDERKTFLEWYDK